MSQEEKYFLKYLRYHLKKGDIFSTYFFTFFLKNTLKCGNLKTFCFESRSLSLNFNFV